MVHDFTLVYALNPELDSQDEILRRLVGSDCADAMVGWGRPGHVALAFGYHRAPAQAWAHRAFGSRESICQRRGKLLAAHHVVVSMSRKGNCWDNAVMERFFLNLKMERVWQRDYANHAEAITDITDYIVGFYNSVRLHSTLGYRAPTHYEMATA